YQNEYKIPFQYLSSQNSFQYRLVFAGSSSLLHPFQLNLIHRCKAVPRDDNMGLARRVFCSTFLAGRAGNFSPKAHIQPGLEARFLDWSWRAELARRANINIALPF
ncbi:hypothetical protein Lal_00033800, partial [Lupinus albus]